jgi:hypothetical protein
MNWEAIGAIAELLGALGVIGSLIYVGNQVRTSNVASSVAAKLSAAQMLSAYQDTMVGCYRQRGLCGKIQGIYRGRNRKSKK